MRHLENTGLFILSGFFFLFFRKLDYFFVCAFLLCLCLCCTSYFAQSKRLHLVLCTAFIAAAFLIPGMFLFFPAVFYVLLLDQYHIPALSCSVLYFYGIWSDGERIPLFSFWGIFLFLLAFRLQNRTEAAECLEQRLMKLRDDSTEKNLLLEEKNRMLAEKQDYEVYAATLKERNRIAREIHDNVGHLLSRSILITGAAKALNASDALSPVLDNLDHSLNQAMTSIRSSVHDLHDESLNLKEAAESLTSDFTFCPVTLHYDMGFEVPREIKYCFISIVKEALSNVARHSNATLVQITMREHPALYQLCIEDNGTLTESNLETLLPNRGIGLSNMNDRLKVLNGNLQITIQKGVRLFITIPKEQEY